jgi:hypothetical protein
MEMQLTHKILDFNFKVKQEASSIENLCKSEVLGIIEEIERE